MSSEEDVGTNAAEQIQRRKKFDAVAYYDPLNEMMDVNNVDNEHIQDDHVPNQLDEEASINLNAIGLNIQSEDSEEEDLQMNPVDNGIQVIIGHEGNAIGSISAEITNEPSQPHGSMAPDQSSSSSNEESKTYSIADGLVDDDQSDVCDFHIALMVFAISADLSCRQYTVL